jgi:hypothetical protein
LPLVSYELTRRGFFLNAYDKNLTIWLGVIAPPASGKNTCVRWARKLSVDVYQGIFGPDLAPQPWLSLDGSMQGVMAAISARQEPDLPIIPGILFHTEAHKVFLSDEAPGTLCQIYDGESIERNFRYLQEEEKEGARDRVKMKPPLMSTVLATTQASLAPLVKREVLEGGLFSRVLWMHERTDPKTLMPQPLEDEGGRTMLVQRWQHWIRTLDGIRLQGCTPSIPLSAAAKEFLEGQLFDFLRTNISSESAMESGVALRAMPHAAKIAACYAASRLNFQQAAPGAPLSLVIDYDDIVRAANFVIRCFQSAMELGGRMAVQRLNIEDRRARIEHALLQAGGEGLTKRDLYKLFHGNVIKQQLDGFIAELEESDLLVQYKIVVGGRGRPMVRVFHVNHEAAAAAKLGSTKL